MKKTVLVLSVVLLFVLASCTGFTELKKQSVTILSVGIDYKNSGQPGNILYSTINDAKEFGYALKTQYERLGVESNLIYMLQEGALHSLYADEYYPNSTNIMEMISSLSFKENDLFVLYYSGHGIDDKPGMSLACAAFDGQLFTRLPAYKLIEKLESLPCRSVVVLDCCFSGACDNQYEEMEPISFFESFQKLNDASELQKVTVLAACQSNQESVGIPFRLEDESFDQHGLFTYEILKQIGWSHSSEKHYVYEQKDKDYSIYGNSSVGVRGLTTKELFDSIMKEWGSKYGDYGQTPMMYGTNVSTCLIPRF